MERPEWQLCSNFSSGRSLALRFMAHTRWEVGQILQQMVEMDNFFRLVDLLKVLQIMATSQQSPS